MPPINAGGIINNTASQLTFVSKSIKMPPKNTKTPKKYKNNKIPQVRLTSADLCNKDENSVVRYIVKIQKWKGDDTS